jgi:hypothetical protein
MRIGLGDRRQTAAPGPDDEDLVGEDRPHLGAHRGQERRREPVELSLVHDGPVVALGRAQLGVGIARDALEAPPEEIGREERFRGRAVLLDEIRRVGPVAVVKRK